MSRLRPMSEAPRDREFILAKVADDGLAGGMGEHYAGRWFVIRHEGVTQGGYDMGWGLFPGFGGVSDRHFAGWLPHPRIPSL